MAANHNSPKGPIFASWDARLRHKMRFSPEITSWDRNRAPAHAAEPIYPLFKSHRPSRARSGRRRRLSRLRTQRTRGVPRRRMVSSRSAFLAGRCSSPGGVPHREVAFAGKRRSFAEMVLPRVTLSREAVLSRDAPVRETTLTRETTSGAGSMNGQSVSESRNKLATWKARQGAAVCPYDEPWSRRQMRPVIETACDLVPITGALRIRSA